MSPPNLAGFTIEKLTRWVVERGEPAFRARQIFTGIHRHDWRGWEQFTTLAKTARERLSLIASLARCGTVETAEARDGSAWKLALRCDDGERFECVLLRDAERVTACLSSQSGCALGCAFCATGQSGPGRNLATHEIVDQLAALRGRGRITNVVFMGMGEPLLNVDAVLDAVDVLTCDLGVGLASRKITVSTAGVTPGIEALSRHKGQMGLAVSVGSPFESERQDLMPISRSHPLAEVLAAAHRYVDGTRRRLTLEYVLLRGVNDSSDHARALAALARKHDARVNLIAFNPAQGLPFSPPSDEEMDRFAAMVAPVAPAVTVRRSIGAEVMAACGQLARRKT